MSERKSAEIKFRCTPSFKAAVQARAEAEGVSASQLLENSVNEHIWAEQNERLMALKDAHPLVMPAAQSEYGSPDAPALSGGWKWNTPPVEAELAALRAAVPPLEEDASVVGCTCRSWEFCTHKADA